MNTHTNPPNIKLIVCDMAGTTVDEKNLVYITLRNAIAAFGHTLSLEDTLALGAGKEKKEAIRAILTTLGYRHDEPHVDEIFQHFLPLLKEGYEQADLSEQPNAMDFFKAVKSRNQYLVLNTGYNRQTAEMLLARLGWIVGKDIDALVTADDVANGRPDPAMILHAMHLFDIDSADQVVKIGDSQIDIEEGQNAGCRYSIGITTGAHTRNQLTAAKPDYIVDNLLDILPLLDKDHEQ